MDFNFETCPDRTETDSTKWHRYAGRDVLPAWVADMDFSTAPAIVEALKKRIEHGVFGYPTPRPQTFDAIVNYLAREHGWQIDPDWIVFLPALVAGINASIRAVGQPGDSVMVPIPAYPPFLSAPVNSTRIAKRVPMILQNGNWQFDLPALEAATTPDAKIFLLCSPYNPLGRVFTREELLSVTDYCTRHNLVICSDEIHCDIVHNSGSRHIPTASLSPEIAQRTITLLSASKTYNIPGLTCGYAVIPNADLRTRFRRVIAGIATDVNIFGYLGMETAYNEGGEWHRACLDYLRGNLDLICEKVRTMPGVTLHQRPQATYLAWLDVRELNLENPYAAFEQGGVGLGDGADFGTPGFVRLNFGCPRERLREILRRIGAVAEQHQPAD
mgnify:CR=1 FL=1